MDTLKDRIKGFAASTHGPEVLDSSGSFAGLYQLIGYQEPVLVASTDGVGTKIKIAAQLGHFESIGQDLVTLNVNDIITRGAKPLFFLDYVAFSDLDVQRLDNLMRGIAWGCRQVGCALISGETAQMPQVYAGDEMDLAGFVVGAVERNRLLESQNIEAGNVLIGVPSSGLHTNGFSLVRHVFNSDEDPSILYRRFSELNHQLGEELLIPPKLLPTYGARIWAYKWLGPHHRWRYTRQTPFHTPRESGRRNQSRIMAHSADFSANPKRRKNYR